MKALSGQLENMDVNRRMNSVLLRFEDFGRRSRDENLEERVAEILNQRFPDLKISVNDFQTVHRLQDEKSVICNFFSDEFA